MVDNPEPTPFFGYGSLSAGTWLDLPGAVLTHAVSTSQLKSNCKEPVSKENKQKDPGARAAPCLGPKLGYAKTGTFKHWSMLSLP